MQEKLYLGVRNNATGDYYVAACALPAQIGKQHDVNNQVLLDPAYRTISRVHGMIERSQRGFVYTDSSANGSRVGGLVVRDQRVALSPNFEIEIENYTITRIEAQPFIVLTTSLDLRQLQTMELLPGRGIGIGDVLQMQTAKPARRAAVAEYESRYEIVDLNRWTEWGLPLVARLEAIDGQVTLIVNGNAGVPVLQNKTPVTQGRLRLNSLDVLRIEGTRIEIFHPHESRIVCGHDRCNLLNPPPLEANCRFCGHHLANTGGFTRII